MVSPHLLPEPAIVACRADLQLVTASVGVAPFAPDATDSEPLLAAADAALYEVKRAGGNACVSRAPE